jgi:hypothetical protein
VESSDQTLRFGSRRAKPKSGEPSNERKIKGQGLKYYKLHPGIQYKFIAIPHYTEVMRGAAPKISTRAAAETDRWAMYPSVPEDDLNWVVVSPNLVPPPPR